MKALWVNGSWRIFCDIIAERGREASVLSAKLDGHVCNQHLRGSLGIRSRVRVRRLGQRDQLCEASGHIWALCQVLPMQASSANSGAPACNCPAASLSPTNRSRVSLPRHRRLRENSVIEGQVRAFFWPALLYKFCIIQPGGGRAIFTHPPIMACALFSFPNIFFLMV